MTEDLKPCHHCGYADPYVLPGPPRHMVDCPRCGARGPTARTAKQAKKLWNTRAPVKVKPLVWENWNFGDAFARTVFGIYNTREREWREPKARTRWHKADDPRAAAQADYERRIREALE